MARFLAPDKHVILFTGNYGSGKTEVSVNVVSAFARAGETVSIVDMDLVNPYFRCREAREPMEELGIRVIAPEGAMHNADLPIVLPQVRTLITQPEGVTVFDVGGDNVGATVLSSLKTEFSRQPYEMIFVLNKNRPFTGTVAGAMQLMDEIEAASKLSITGIAGNTHLMDETDLAMVREGAEFTRAAARERGVDIAFVTAPVEQLRRAELITDEPETGKLVTLEGFDAPVLPLKRIMLPPWLGGPAPGSMATHSRDNMARLTGRSN